MGDKKFTSTYKLSNFVDGTGFVPAGTGGTTAPEFDIPNQDLDSRVDDIEPYIAVGDVNPQVTDDGVAGFAVGQHWINTVTPSEWVCSDNSTGAAVWTNLTASGTGVAADPIWDAVGDLAVGSGPDTAVRLPRGGAGNVLRVNLAGTDLEYAAPAGGGDMLAANNLSEVISPQTSINNISNVAAATAAHVLTKVGANAVFAAPSGGGDLLADGSVPLTANWDVGAWDISAEQFHSDIVTGTAPLTVSSTTIVANLNADLLDGVEASAMVRTTGNESIAGVKTFTSDPIIPDEAYAIGWNASLEPPTKNAVYDKLELMKVESFIIAASDETTALTASPPSKTTFRMPYAFTLTGVKASLTTASSGATVVVDIKDGGVSIMTTNKLDILNGATLDDGTATLTDLVLAEDAVITIDVVVSGTGATGLKVYLIGSKT